RRYEQHDRSFCSGQCREIFGVPAEDDSAIVDRTLLQRGRYEGCESAAGAAFHRALYPLDQRACVPRIGSAADLWVRQWLRHDQQLTAACVNSSLPCRIKLAQGNVVPAQHGGASQKRLRIRDDDEAV